MRFWQHLLYVPINKGLETAGCWNWGPRCVFSRFCRNLILAHPFSFSFTSLTPPNRKLWLNNNSKSQFFSKVLSRLVLGLLWIIIPIVLKGMESLEANEMAHFDFAEFAACVGVLGLIMYFAIPSFAPLWEMGILAIQTEMESRTEKLLVDPWKWNSWGFASIQDCGFDEFCRDSVSDIFESYFHLHVAWQDTILNDDQSIQQSIVKYPFPWN